MDFKVGDRVRVKSSVRTPYFDWGSVQHGDIGVITSINGGDAECDFDAQTGWSALLSEMEKVEPENIGSAPSQREW